MAKYNNEYQRNRKTLLASDTTCWICGRDGADTADHVIPLMSGGTHDLDNLRPAHQRCNSIRGSHDQRRNALSRTNTPQRFFNATTDDPCPPFRLFGETSPDQPEPAHTGPDQPGVGRGLPRLETAGVGENGNGLAVARWAEAHMGVTLMAWQVRALCGQLSVRDDGRLRFRESLVSTARQNGKSVALCALIGWWLTERAATHGPQNVLSVANRLDRAEAIFGTLAPVLVEKFGAKARHQLGQKSVTMVDGSQWEVRAASKRLHGGSNDLIVLDELFDIKPEVLDEALRPSQIARREPLLSAWSTAGDEESAAMITMREAAITAIDAATDTGVYFAEWSIPPGADWRDETFWGWSNPSLGTTITLEALRAASGKDSFKRAHLNLWVAARGAWLEPGVWDKLCADEIPAGGVLSVDISSDGNRYAGVRAVTVAGITYTKLEFSVASENEMWAEVARVTADPKTVLTVGPGLDAHLPKVLERRTMIAGAKEVSRYTGLVRGMIVAGQIRHDGSTALAEHVNRAVAITVNGNLVLAANRSPGPIELCRLLVIACAVASKPQTSTKPILVVAG